MKTKKKKTKIIDKGEEVSKERAFRYIDIEITKEKNTTFVASVFEYVKVIFELSTLLWFSVLFSQTTVTTD